VCADSVGKTLTIIDGCDETQRSGEAAMAYEVLPGTRPNQFFVRFYGELTGEDLDLSTQALGLDRGQQVYVLCDITELIAGLPDNFMVHAQRSYFVHENMKHAAMISHSWLLNNVAKMFAKLTRRQDRLSIHLSREAAMEHLTKVMNQAGVS
jgi:hypothetical protein